jgi:hypothetical protein
MRRIIFACSIALAAQAHAAEAGKVIFTAGASQIGGQRAAEGAAVQEGDLLATGADGYLYVKTVDNGLFILRPNTKARIAAYQVDTRNPANTHVKLELLSGVARSKSGDAVKLARQNFRFNTPVAAIGVRGTDFTVYTNEDTSRVAVLTGRVVVSGFGGACSPEGGGPCDGAASRELSAAQRGQLLQIQRGQAAPQLLPSVAGAPDQVSPPRADEPVAKAGTGDNLLDAKTSARVEQFVSQQPTPAPVPPPVTLPVTPPPIVDVGTPPPPPVVVPDSEIQWGRWASLAGRAPTIALNVAGGMESVVGGNYVLYRTAGKAYETPERGSVAFNLKGGEAYILDDDATKAAQQAQIKNGLLSFNFDKASFATSFDLVSGQETFKLQASGAVSPTGRFGNDTYDRLMNGGTQVDGMLSNANGGSAAYVFQRRLDETRTANGVTYWAK